MISSSANLQVVPAQICSDEYVVCGVTIRIACFNRIFNYGILAYSTDVDHLIDILGAAIYGVTSLLDVSEVARCVSRMIRRDSGIVIVRDGECAGINVLVRSSLYRREKDVREVCKLKRGIALFESINRIPLGIVALDLKRKELQSIAGKARYYDCILYDVGLVRRNNEDSGIVISMDMRDRENRFLVLSAAVADGVGGLEYGEKASYIAVRNLATYMFIEEDPQTILEKAIRRAHVEIQEYSVYMGKASATTFTGIVIVENELHLAHVGDSIAFIYDNSRGMIKLCSEHARDNVLMQAVGYKIDKVEHNGPIPLSDNALIILATDGLSKVVQEQELQLLIDPEDLEKTCKNIQYEVRRRGAPDNVTLILLKIGKEINQPRELSQKKGP
ncbi:MAG: serine/threonine-protein phosphatase [Crenarchaeota archaeon]|nr:serine/threonine-protein phosphatase [Thermoproteota archaeon]